MHHVIIEKEEAEAALKNPDMRFMRLWDLYNGLLTKTQREITNLYFDCDLSLGEIAEQKGVSRQSVSDCLHQCRKKLEQAEEKLHFAKALDEVSRDYSLYMTRVKRWAAAQEEKHPEWKQDLQELKEIRGSDEEIIVEIKE